MIYTSTILAEASGSLGGAVFSHNAGGQYIRRRAVPTNPNSVYQQAVRSFMALLSQTWASLTDDERATWEFLGEYIGTTNSLGMTKRISGLAFFCKTNVGRLQAGLTAVTDPVGAFNPGDFGAPTMTVDASDGEAELTFDNTKAWALTTGGHMLVYLSRGYKPTIKYFNGPYRFAAVINGATPTAPSSPATITLPFAVNAGEKVHGRIVVVDDAGLNSSPFRLSGDVAA